MARVEICGVDTSKIPKLKSKEMDELLFKAKAGSKDAKEKFIYYNYRLVLSITHRFLAKKDNVDDIFQVGVIGLIKAYNNFDLSYNLKFSTYAVPMILGEIKRYLRDDSFLKVSRSIKDLAYQILKYREQKEHAGQKEPTVEELAKNLNVSTKMINLAIDSSLAPVSIYEKVFDNSGDKVLLIDKVDDSKNSFEKQIETLALKNALLKLDSKEKDIVLRRYFEGKTQTEVSAEVGISQAQVSRLEKSALKSLQMDL